MYGATGLLITSKCDIAITHLTRGAHLISTNPTQVFNSFALEFASTQVFAKETNWDSSQAFVAFVFLTFCQHLPALRLSCLLWLLRCLHGEVRDAGFSVCFKVLRHGNKSCRTSRISIYCTSDSKVLPGDFIRLENKSAAAHEVY